MEHYGVVASVVEVVAPPQYYHLYHLPHRYPPPVVPDRPQTPPEQVAQIDHQLPRKVLGPLQYYFQ